MNTRLLFDLGLGSLELVDVVSALEERFVISLQPSDLMGVDTVAELVTAVEAAIDASINRRIAAVHPR